MNFRSVVIILSIFCFGCGVKSKPLSPPETAIQSYVNSFLDKETTTPPSTVPTK